MVTSRKLSVQPSVLFWARSTSGLSIAEAASRIGVSAERIAEWENGGEPTVVQLRKAANVYNRPFAALFLQEPPLAEDVFDLPDFRRADAAGAESGVLRRAILRAQRQQEALREVIEDGSGSTIEPAQVITLSSEDSAETSGRTLRAALGFSDVPSRVRSHPADFLRQIVINVENLGYIVLQVQRVPVEEMRGFSISDSVAPVIALNGADWPRGKLYTLLHEVAHIGLRESALCDLSRENESALERYCDAVAAAALMPADEFAVAAEGVKIDSYRSLADLASPFGASAESALLRLIGIGRATWDQYFAMKSNFRDAYLQFKQDEKDASASKESPIFYQLKARDLGRSFVRKILRAHGDGIVSARDVTNLLEVSYDKVPRLAQTVGSGD